MPEVGSVSQQRYEEIVAELREAVSEESKGRWLVGDRALEIEPMRPRGGRQAAIPGELPFSVRDALFMLAEDVGLNYR
ncbi:RacO protein, partial [Streptomyces albiflaviniger]|nr:RacO protein [Streptomyces albiflaviniger]